MRQIKKTFKLFKIAFRNRVAWENFFRSLRNQGIKKTIKKVRHYVMNYNTVEINTFNRNNSQKNLFKPLVSIVVPNYNHENFLKQRLDSIYAQTYSNIEVILLDDCSSDNSRDILESYYLKNQHNTRYIPNSKNSGGVFFQWKKAFELAKGELIWIAESDDFADINFLDILVPYFIDSTINLAYCYSKFINQHNRLMEYSFDSHVSSIDINKWKQDYINTAANEVYYALSVKNTIPNVSSVLMRKKYLNIFNNIKWLNMKICGDWILYLEIIRGGKIAFSRKTTNYFRFHNENSSGKTYKTFSYVHEHQFVAEYLVQNYIYSPDKLEQFQRELERFWHCNIAKNAKENFNDHFKLDYVISLKNNRKANLLIGVVSFIYGGGELYPIRLANEMYKRGYAVTLFNLNIYKENLDVRNLVDIRIPILDWNGVDSVDKILINYKIEIISTHHAAVDKFFAVRKDLSNIRQVVSTHGMYEIIYEESLDDFKYLSQNFLGVNYWVYTADKNLKPFIESDLYDNSRFIKVDNGYTAQPTGLINRESLNIDKDEFVICLTSRAIKEKGWDIAIDAFKLVSNKLHNKRLHLILIGEGPIYNELIAQKLPKNISLLGYRKNTIDYYSISDIGILPTIFQGESFPLCLIECMFAKKPIIATAIGEIPYMLKRDGREAGILIEYTDYQEMVNQLSNAIYKLIVDKDLYNKLESNTIYCAERFDFKYVGNKYEEIFKLAQTNDKPHLGKYYQLYYSNKN